MHQSLIFYMMRYNYSYQNSMESRRMTTYFISQDPPMKTDKANRRENHPAGNQNPRSTLQLRKYSDRARLYSVGATGWVFFRLCSLSLSRNASNAITKLPKAISKPIIPINIKMISAAAIDATSLPMYSGSL